MSGIFGIEEAARQAGISRQSLQYYLKLRLVEPATGRLFDKMAVERVRLIKKLNDSGYPLRAIQELFLEGRSYLEKIYDQSQSFLRPEETAQIATVSHEAWTKLIGELSRHPELLHSLNPRKFEELIAELLYREGLEVHLTPKTRDGGRDILAFHQTSIGNHLYLVECKRHQPKNPVGIAIVQRLYGIIAQEKATAGLIVTTSHFSKSALTFAETIKHQIGLKDYEDVKCWLQSQILT